jgi:catechol 2,3-dioxygenase-like lactoylglutathione lyase family enzyme
MTEPAPGIDDANLPAPAEGVVVALFITVRKVARSRDFYSRVLGGTVVLDENPCMVKLSNSWIIMNPGGPPTPDKPGISVVDYQPGDTTSIFLNLRVADIQACYEEWQAKGAEFVTAPIDRGAEIRCYLRDPDGYLIEVGQSTGLLHGKLDLQVGSIGGELGEATADDPLSWRGGMLDAGDRGARWPTVVERPMRRAGRPPRGPSRRR